MRSDQQSFDDKIYRELEERLRTVLPSSKDDEISADPQIKANLSRQVLKQRDQQLVTNHLERFFSLMRTRIPVYQTVLSMMVFAFILININWLSSSRIDQGAGTSNHLTLPADTSFLNVADSAQSIPVRSVYPASSTLAEDSLISVFFNPTL